MISLVAVDGGWSEWSQFSPCSKTCGGGSITRFRNCNNPSPLNGGKNCPGEYFESQDCNTDPCKSLKQLSGLNHCKNTPEFRSSERKMVTLEQLECLQCGLWWSRSSAQTEGMFQPTTQQWRSELYWQDGQR